jgi:hypothetical protein
MLAKFGVLAVGGLLCADAKVIELGDRLGVGVHSRTDHEAHVAAAGFGGDKMERVYGKYAGLPMGEDALIAANWTKMVGDCNEKLGYAYTLDASGPTEKEPLIVYVTKGGQPAGVGTIVRPGPDGTKGLGAQQANYASPALPSWIKLSNAQLIEVAFRSGAIICDGNMDSSKVGTELTLNPRGGTQQNIPITQDQVEKDGWRQGSCYSGMGFHYFYDMKNSANGKFVFHHETVGPLVPMYHEGEINAIFFMAQQDQGTQVEGGNRWDPAALNATAMCKNGCAPETCSKNFSPPSGGFWNMMHIYFRDHDKVDCKPEENNLDCVALNPARNCCAKDAKEDKPPDDGASRVSVLAASLLALGVASLQ